MPIELPFRLSYSSLSSYAECGERWRLERGYRLKSGTWWATVAGSAVHTITEAEDRRLLGEDVHVPTWEEAFAAEIAAVPEGVEIKASGKKLKAIGATGGPNKKDKEWWDIYGPIYVQRWLDWRDAKLAEGWKFATMPDGTSGIEVRVKFSFNGKDQLGYIDRVMIDPNGLVVVVDIKNGNVPTSSLQLGTYAEALRQSWGIEVDYGAYWMAKDGDMTTPKDMTWYSHEYIEAQFDMAWRGIQAGVFLANPSSYCSSCGVRDYCRSFGGLLSPSIPTVDTLIEAKPHGEPRAVPVETEGESDSE